jgi:hypothetical protein
MLLFSFASNTNHFSLKILDAQLFLTTVKFLVGLDVQLFFTFTSKEKYFK